MESSIPPLQTVSISFPKNGLAQISRWAEKGNLSFDKFCTVAIILGTRIQAISLEPVGSLPPTLRKQAAQAANSSITPDTLLRIVTGDKPLLESESPLDLDGRVEVILPADILTQLEKVADISGIEHTKLKALALATGVQMLATSLASESSVPPEVLVQMTEGEVTPLVLMQAIMKRREEVQTKKKTPGTE
jgi:hypothetical protein